MSAGFVSKILEAGLVLWLLLLLLFVLGNVKNGKIRTRGLLTGKASRAGKETQPERAVAAAVVPLVIGLYLIHVVGVWLIGVPSGTRPSIPDVPEYLVTLLTGGNSFYLAGKFFRHP